MPAKGLFINYVMQLGEGRGFAAVKDRTRAYEHYGLGQGTENPKIMLSNS